MPLCWGFWQQVCESSVRDSLQDPPKHTRESFTERGGGGGHRFGRREHCNGRGLRRFEGEESVTYPRVRSSANSDHIPPTQGIPAGGSTAGASWAVTNGIWHWITTKELSLNPRQIMA